MDMYRITAELVVGFFGLFVMSRLLGKTQITQITTFDFISALVLGELVGNAVYDDEIGLIDIIFAIFVWGLLIFVIEWLTQKSNKARIIMEGSPTIIIRNGQILRSQLKKEKLDLNQLQHLIRSKGTFSMREIEFAILETDGSVSILKKPQYDLPVRSDFSFSGTSPVLPYSLVLDGSVQRDNLEEAGLEEEWLKKELSAQDIHSYKHVLYAEWRKGEGLYVQKK
ncbi:DUF421 domain-containing protein [Bacillus sp. FJAT-42376]|uniref:DUF421 domain-containing protein n=1 Tax=Bacillus sp. FJAT-42376 TaxID=2014076 RepID=UPI000F4E59B6|nr:DUF421 domain-containing protein [Bacillus sp. FJAT-42376]AZB42410.1 DUF421 domain-containing protein [Bacillus sp. FJAT-42376]